MAKPTPEEIEAARALVAAAYAEAALQMQAELDARLAPLREFVASPAFAEVKAAARAMAPTYRDDESLYVHLRPIPDFMDRLSNAMAVPSTPVASA